MNNQKFTFAALVLTLFFINAFAQKEDEFLARRDSVILQTEYGCVYYTTDTASKIYNWFVPADLTNHADFSLNIFKTYKKHITTEHNVPIKSFKDDFLNSKWTEIYRYNNAYCLHAPSDWMSHHPLYLSDSILYGMHSDADLKIITNFKKLSNNKFTIKLINYSGIIELLSITIIDPINGIAIWESKSESGRIKFNRLFVKSENVKRFPAVVSDCGDTKCYMEFKFDEVDYSKLIE